MNFLTALLSGVLFGAGLLLSGMSNPANVLGFLDVAGDWNPSLAFVMAGAIFVAAPAFAWARRHPRTFDGQPIALPGRRSITARLLVGSALFGLGWGLVGLCPGPALVVLGQGSAKVAVFVAALAVGLGVVALKTRSSRNASPVQTRSP